MPPPPPPPPYGSYEGFGPPHRAPEPVLNAVRLMWLTAAVSLLSLVLVFSLRNDLRNSVRDANPDVSEQRLNSLVNTAIAVAVAIAIVFILLYVLLSFQVRKGKRWARVVTWILAGLGVISAISSLAQDTTTTSKILNLIGGAVDLTIILLLSRPESNTYFAKRYYPPY